MTSTKEPSATGGGSAPRMGRLRLSFFVTIMVAVLALIIYASLSHSVPNQTLVIMLIGWVIPVAMLVAHLRSRSSH